MILAPAAAEVVTAGVAEAPPFEPAHQALGNLVKTLPVLLGNEDPGKHCGFREKAQIEEKNSREAEEVGCPAFTEKTILIVYISKISQIENNNRITSQQRFSQNPHKIILISQCIRRPKNKTEGSLL